MRKALLFVASLVPSFALVASACGEGATGPQGAAGTNGQPGTPGTPGTQGPQGEPGEAGFSGQIPLGDGGVSSNGGPVVWRTTTGATVAVVAAEVGGDRVWVADTRGFVWRMSAVDGTLAALPEATPVQYFLTPDCSGTGYVQPPFLARKVFKPVDASAPLRAVPDSPTWTILDAGLDGGSQLSNGSCTPYSGLLLRFVRGFPATELEPDPPIEAPAPIADTPLHPEVLP